MKLWLDRMIFPVTALGPGNRLCLWVAGCTKRCPGCANPELWNRKEKQAVEIERLKISVDTILNTKPVDGITISGGEPFDQAKALTVLLDGLPGKPDDILVFSGYLLSELLQSREKKDLLDKVGVLIDGPYIRERNDGISALRGSDNQRIHYLKQSLQESYNVYLKHGRQIQNIVYDYQIMSIGIHHESGRKPECP